MPEIVLTNITKSWPRAGGKKGERTVGVDNLNLTIKDRGFITLLGPSGCGKTTTLRMIAGLETPTSGKITIGGKVVFDSEKGINISPDKRNVGFLFQNYALWPHMTVYKNIAFGLENMKWKKEDIKARVTELLAMLKIDELGDRYPSELSGGQQQRVAIARALVNRPQVLLLDEPLGALDLRLRKDMQNELKNIQQRMGITFIYVTHDQEEALTMSDTIVVMNKGKIQQIGTPEDIYNEPKNAFVADFIGESNIIDGIMRADGVVEIFNRRFQCLDKGFEKDEPVDVVIRPEDVDIVDEAAGQLKGTVTNVTFKGMHYDIIVDFYGFKWLIQTTDFCPEGSHIGIKIDPDGFHVMKKSHYSGMFGDYSSYSEEYDEIGDATYDPDQEEDPREDPDEEE